MAEPCSSACSAWTTTDDMCAPCDNYDSIDPDRLETMINVASDILFELSGRQFPGACQDTVRPCRQTIPSGRFCGCWSRSSCGCGGLSEVSLGVYPLTSIIEVKVDGQVLDPDFYRIDNFQTLVRLPDANGKRPGWPTCQDLLLDSDQVGTWEVTFTYGRRPPAAGVLAASVLACELLQACGTSIDGAECRLPKRVVNLARQGVSMILQDPTQILTQGRFSIPEIDQFISTYNPHNLRRRSTVISPDIGPRVRRVGT